MIKTLTLLCAALTFCSFKSEARSVTGGLPDVDTSKSASVIISPAKPLIEKDIFGYYLSFDIIIKNQTKHTLELSSTEVMVMDPAGKLVLRKCKNQNDQSQGAETLSIIVIKPGETVSIFNPFRMFPPDVTIGALKYGLYFNYADSQQQKEKNKKRLTIDYDLPVIKMITPQVYIAKNEYYLPLKGKLIVWNGHDYYSHHRRLGDADAKQETKETSTNASRYAYDLMSIDGNGNMYHDSPFKKQNWYVFGQAVMAPANGKVVNIQNSIPDNEFNGRSIQSPKLASNVDPLGMGNYVIIDQGNGEFSMLLHLEKGSVRVKVGDVIKSGDVIGSVGFSGDAIYPHLYYTVTNGSKETASEGIPSYFNSYKLYRGNNTVNIARSRVDSGDIVESAR